MPVKLIPHCHLPTGQTTASPTQLTRRYLISITTSTAFPPNYVFLRICLATKSSISLATLDTLTITAITFPILVITVVTTSIFYFLYFVLHQHLITIHVGLWRRAGNYCILRKAWIVRDNSSRAKITGKSAVPSPGALMMIVRMSHMVGPPS